MAPLGEGAATGNRILEREARKSALFAWLHSYIWSDSTAVNWLKVGPPCWRRPCWRPAEPPAAPASTTPALPPPPLPQDPAALRQDHYRSLWSSFAGSELAKTNVPRMARHLAGKLGLTASSKADPAEALGQQGAAALEGLVAAAMLAHLRVKGCGLEQRIIVKAQRRGKGGQPCAAPLPRP
jgi:hypothetical protein